MPLFFYFTINCLSVFLLLRHHKLLSIVYSINCYLFVPWAAPWDALCTVTILASCLLGQPWNLSGYIMSLMLSQIYYWYCSFLLHCFSLYCTRSLFRISSLILIQTHAPPFKFQRVLPSSPAFLFFFFFSSGPRHRLYILVVCCVLLFSFICVIHSFYFMLALLFTCYVFFSLSDSSLLFWVSGSQAVELSLPAETERGTILLAGSEDSAPIHHPGSTASEMLTYILVAVLFFPLLFTELCYLFCCFLHSIIIRLLFYDRFPIALVTHLLTLFNYIITFLHLIITLQCLQLIIN